MTNNSTVLQSELFVLEIWENLINTYWICWSYFNKCLGFMQEIRLTIIHSGFLHALSFPYIPIFLRYSLKEFPFLFLLVSCIPLFTISIADLRKYKISLTESSTNCSHPPIYYLCLFCCERWAFLLFFF